MRKQRREYDRAYGCFLFCGLVTLTISVMSAIPMDTGMAGGLGILVAVPLSLASLVAMVVGIGLSLRRRHWPLLVLSAMSVLLIAEILTEVGSTEFYNAAPAIYGAGVVLISGMWFLILRRRKFPPRKGPITARYEDRPHKETTGL